VNLTNHYNELWNRSLQKFKKSEFEYDPFINSINDNRYGITLLARPTEKVKQNIANILDELKAAEPNQYYYPGSDLHLTILSIISCRAGFSLNEINPSEYQEIVQSAVDSASPFTINFQGFTASPSSILIQGLPDHHQLSGLRNELREKFKTSGLMHSMDKRYHLKTAHMTAIRFKEPLKNAEAFIQKVSKCRQLDFGSSRITKVELVKTNWYHQQDKVKTLAVFPLNNQL